MIEVRVDGVAPATVFVSGELDLATTPGFKDTARGAIDASNGTAILDLSGVEFMDSTGLGAIVALHKRAREAGGNLRICCVPAVVSRVFDVSGLGPVLDLYPTHEEALKG